MPSLFLPLKSAGSTISFVLKGVRSQGQEWGQGCWVQKCQCGHFRGHAHWILLAMGGSVYGCGLLTPVNTKICVCVCARSVTQSCLTDCDPMDCSPPVFLCPWDFSSNHTGEGCHFLLQRIFPTQGSNLGLLHLQEGSFPLRHLGSHKYKIHKLKYKYVGGFPWWLRDKEPTCQ